jgi:hypothetical protein
MIDGANRSDIRAQLAMDHPGRALGRRPAAEVTAELGLVVEDIEGYVGEIVALAKDAVTLEDRHRRRRLFRYGPGYLIDGRPILLIRPSGACPERPTRTASGSRAVAAAPARVARASRILVEGVHDAELVEKVWGDDLRIEGVVVEPLHGIDDLAGVVAEFRPTPTRRLGVLVDHLVAGSKESRLVGAVRHEYVLVTGHPYVDIWQAVKPATLGIPAWPVVPPGRPWKEGVCAALGVGDPREMWRRVLGSVRTYADLETPLLGAVERLIDFVTE